MIKGRNVDKELFVAGNRTVFDLSGAGASEMVLYNRNHDIKINKVWVKFEEASSADTGVALKIGNASTADAYFTVVSENSRTAGDSLEYDTGSLTLQTVPKDTPIYVSSAGGKSGDGTAYVWFSYTVI